MELKQLYTFLMASETLNFTKTAQMLNYAQSSVTAQIKALERDLETPLFDRLGKRLILTEEGHQFRSYAKSIVNLSEEAKKTISDSQETITIRIGAQESQCTYRLPHLLKEFKQKYPLVRLVFIPNARGSSCSGSAVSAHRTDEPALHGRGDAEPFRCPGSTVHQRSGCCPAR